MIGSTRAEKKESALLRAQLSLKQAHERIDYAIDVIAPRLAEMRELAKVNDITFELGEGELSADADTEA